MMNLTGLYQFETMLHYIGLFMFLHCTLIQFVIPSARYFTMHILANMCIIYFSYEAVPLFLADPGRAIFSTTDSPNHIPNIITASLHIYHILMYDIKRVDIIHHYPGFVGNAMNALYPSDTLQNFTFFFIMGVPGLIDYILLVFAKYGYIDIRVEKYVNTRLNLYLRLPGLILSSTAIVFSLIKYTHLFLSPVHKLCALLSSVHNSWNAIYFANNAMESELKRKNIKEL